jgi:type III secretion protein V
VGDPAYPAAAPIVLLLGDDLLALARADEARCVREGLGGVRERVFVELGVRLPPLAVRPGAPPGAWVLVVDDVPAASGRAPPDEVLALAAPDELALAAIDGRPDRDALTGRAATRVAPCDAERAAALGPVRFPLDRVLADATAALGRAAHLLVGIQEAQALLDALEPVAPALVREASRALPPAVLAEVLRRLVEEGVSIRPLRTILEALLEAGAAARGAPALAEAARRALRRHIGHRCAGDGPLPALLLDPAAENAVREALSGEVLALDPELAARLLAALDREVRDHDVPPVVVASGDVRRALRSLLAPRFPRIAVLSYDDLPPELPVRPIGRLAA